MPKSSLTTFPIQLHRTVGFDSGEFNLIDHAESSPRTVEKLREIATGLQDKVHMDLVAHGSDEIFEEELDHLLRDNTVVHKITDNLTNEIEKRFNHIPAGEMKKTRPGWPLTRGREWSPEKRTEFLRRLSQFFSNHAPLFWRLLTPLVNRVRAGAGFRSHGH